MQVIYVNPFDRVSGYAAAGREYLYALEYAGVKVKPIIFKNNEDPALLTLGEKDRLFTLSKNDVANDAPVIQNTVPDWWQRHDGRKNIGFLFWETEGFPTMWKRHLYMADKHWVCWEETKRSLIGAGVNESNIYVVPPVVNTSVFHPDISPLNIHSDKTFNFLTVFQYSYRKGVDVLLKAYLEEFDISEDVCLIVKAYGSNASVEQNNMVKAWIKSIKSLVKKQHQPKILFRGDIVANNAFPNLLKSADVFVSSPRGEGLGMPMLQSMACGVPVITTGWGAQCQFVNNANGWLINYKKVQVNGMSHSPAYESDQMWAEPDQRHLRVLMREAYNNQELRLSKGIKARMIVDQNYSYQSVGDILIKGLEI